MSKSQDKRINIQKGRDMFAVSDKRLEELIKKEIGIVENCKRWNAEFSEKQAIERLSALKELLEMRPDHEELKAVNAQYEMDCENIDGALITKDKTIKELRKELKEMTEYADKLIDPLDYLPKDIENIRNANVRLHEVEAQNKLLIEDGERLAHILTPNISFSIQTTQHALDQHKALMESIEETV